MKDKHFKDIGSCELEPMACYIKKFTPSFYMGMHNHAYFELMYASKGNFLLEVMPQGVPHENDSQINVVTVHQGELIFVDAFLFHRLVIEEEEVVIYNVEMQPRESMQYDPYRVNRILPVNYNALIEQTSLKTLANAKTGYTVVPNLSRIDSVFRELISNILRPSVTVEDAGCVRAHILLLFMEIARSLTLLEQNNTHYVKKIYLYIKHHLNQKITLDEIAKEVGYHKSYIASQFKKYTGKTIVQAVNELRISKSLRLLRDTGYSVTEIARQVGFPSYAQMAHEFNKTLQLSPSSCRKIFQNDEVDYDSPQYSSIAIRIKEEDSLLSDEDFQNYYYKKNLKSRSKQLLGY